MAETTHNGPPADEHAPTGHEARDVNIPVVLKVGMYLIVLAVVVHILVALLFRRFDKLTDRAQPKLSPLFKKEQVRLPRNLDKIPSPRLQVNDVADMAAVRRYEDAILSGRGPAGAGFEQVPIDDALELLAKSAKARAAAGLVTGAKQGGR